ncbi:MAG: D-2-hydroxyacid dehydrogenase [Candidatus Eisenbacteria bacterium]|uniref:D-2-hydroxyacid dehydrogenase n=1 Tax=Eiseniibacteriota bacterium TaxID=2212470 RepID=A0A933W932_UNCEI|nr:D-2-hydroxyacid dehydrogenase [Candidatus Eisenbacteria bacterium]
MTRPLVLEWVRDPGGVWNVPTTEMARLAAAFPGARFASPATREEAEALLPETDAVFGYLVRPHNLASAAKLRWIHSPAAGVTGLLFPELAASAVTLTNGRGLHARSMAEHALALMLAIARQLPASRDRQREGRWDQVGQWHTAPGFLELAGATLGLVGFGETGKGVATLGKALGMRVLTVRRRPGSDPGPADEQWGTERLGELFAQSDWIVMTAPQTAATVKLVGAELLARMKPTAYLVNLARGALLDEGALLAALDAGQLAGAALDVFETEPLPAGHALWAHPRVVVTPHVGGVGPRYWERACDQFGANLARFLAGEPLFNVVDQRAGY